MDWSSIGMLTKSNRICSVTGEPYIFYILYIISNRVFPCVRVYMEGLTHYKDNSISAFL